MNDAGVPPAIPEALLRGFKIAAILNRGLCPTPVPNLYMAARLNGRTLGGCHHCL